MDSIRWQRIQNLFHAAADLPQSQRQSFLSSACGDDTELASEVIALLEQDSSRDSLLDRALADVAHQTISTPGDIPLKDFGAYRILRVLGEGGMGVVYLAERRDLGNQVAIKVLRDAWLSPSRRERFASEQRTLAQLNHPSIAQLYDADSLQDGTPWFAMERVEGVPLTEYCQEHHSSLEERFELFRSVCEAVQYAHSNAVIHRDLKPSNILVRKDGTIRLLDFGIAKHLENVDSPVNQTMTGLRLMTPAYAAPEQIRGDRVGIQTDVYALGVILYELLTGQLPFDLSNLTPAEAAMVITEHDPGKPSVAVKRSSNTNFPLVKKTAWPDLDVLCLTAMHKEMQRRYRSVEALVRDVDHFLAGEPLEARADTLSYRIGKFVLRNRRSMIATATGMALLAGLIIFFTVRLTRARNLAQEEAARTQRIQQFMMNLFQGGDEAAGPATDMKVITMVDHGVQQAQALSADPRVQADLYETLGSIYQKLGKFDRADSLLQQALNQRKLLFGEDSLEVARSMVALGKLRSDQAQYEQAEKLIRQGLDIEKRHLPSDNSVVLTGETALGAVLAARGNYEQAIAVLNDAVRAQSKPGIAVTPGLANSLSELANAQYEAGHYKIADPLFRRVLEIHRQLYGARHPLVADDLGNLGAVQQDLGYYTEAEKFYRQALDITQSYYGIDHPKTAANLTALGRALVYQNKFDQATALLQQSLAIQEHIYGPIHPAVAEAVNELGNVASMRDHYDEAENQFRRVVDIYRSIYGDHHYLVAIALSNLAYNYYNKKDYARAEELFRDVVHRFTETLSADNVNTGIAHIKLGRVLLRENYFAEAQIESLTGYENLTKQANPGTSYLHAARKDLAAEYDALKQPVQAARFRAELASAE